MLKPFILWNSEMTRTTKVGRNPLVVMAFHELTTFTRRDIQILEEDGFEVVPFHFKGKGVRLILWSFIRQWFTLFRYAGSDVIWVTQSAGHLSLLPVMAARWMRVKVLIVVIGTDGANLPEINYGHFRKPLLGWSTRISLRKAHGIAPVHKSLEESTYEYMATRFPRQGFRSFVDGVTCEVREIVNGYRSDLWGCDLPFEDRQGQFLTVFQASWAEPAIRKGLDLLIEVAKSHPEWTISLVGEIPIGWECPPNLKVFSNVDQPELRAIYNAHRIYIQASVFEGFPNTLCEAMACGCFPVGSPVAGIPDIIASYGLTYPNRDANLLAQAMEKALQKTGSGEADAQFISDHLFERFPYDRRKRELGGFVREIASK